MTVSAWIMLISIWTIVISFTAGFYLKMLRSPKDGDE
jgi:hypothetical protein